MSKTVIAATWLRQSEGACARDPTSTVPFGWLRNPQMPSKLLRQLLASDGERPVQASHPQPENYIWHVGGVDFQLMRQQSTPVSLE